MLPGSYRCHETLCQHLIVVMKFGASVAIVLCMQSTFIVIKYSHYCSGADYCLGEAKCCEMWVVSFLFDVMYSIFLVKCTQYFLCMLIVIKLTNQILIYQRQPIDLYYHFNYYLEFCYLTFNVQYSLIQPNLDQSHNLIMFYNHLSPGVEY